MAFLTLEPADGLFFNLAHTFAGQVEFGADFFEGHFLTAYAEEHFEDFAFTVVELLEGALYFF